MSKESLMERSLEAVGRVKEINLWKGSIPRQKSLGAMTLDLKGASSFWNLKRLELYGYKKDAQKQL